MDAGGPVSINATNWAWALSGESETTPDGLPSATIKLVLLKHADHAHDDGTHTFQSIRSVAKHALCSDRTAQRANAWLVEHGYMREGDQSVIPDSYDTRTRPIAYELAMSEAKRIEWQALHASGCNTLRGRATAAGSKGGRASAEVRRGDNSSPQESMSTGGESGGDNLSPQETASGGDTQGHPGVTDQPSGGDTGVTQTVQEPSIGTTPTSSSAAPAAGNGSPTGSPKKGTRIPDPFEVTPDMVQWAHLETPDVDGRVETQKFVDYWIAKPGKDGLKLDWVATWRNWFRNAQERAGGGRTRRRYDDEGTWGEQEPQRELTDAELDGLFGEAAEPERKAG